MAVEVEEWEYQAAQLLGVNDLKRGNKYKESTKYQLLNVNDESLRRYYSYLENHLAFPFSTTYKEETGYLEVAEFEVNCLRLDPVVQVDDYDGVLLECRQGRKNVLVPLAVIFVDKGDTNLKEIDLYQEWFWNYRSAF
ncbi:calcium-binding protein [Pullulanibacillus sp. KACC 23026]|uniref:calcium-binding protein n=1 Tax=Pullulanibacillus sp. KACC 23026 TaxID=3028315 RepID=UPI0023AE81CB|nr:calcium-binding protein [Pullulanibacillus sp. KACC 23026]WEG11169.1 calcium-binding protein [Pullulanibacillus sp. KACC 23026]